MKKFLLALGLGCLLSLSTPVMAQELAETEMSAAELSAQPVYVMPAQEISAAADSKEEQHPLSLIAKGVEFYKSKNTMGLVGVLIMLLVMWFQKAKFTPTIPKRYIPYTSLALGIFGSLGFNLYAGMGWTDALIQGLYAGALGISAWEVKKTLKKQA